MVTSLVCDAGKHDQCCHATVIVKGDCMVEGIYQGVRWVRTPCECDCHDPGTWTIMSGAHEAHAKKDLFDKGIE